MSGSSSTMSSTGLPVAPGGSEPGAPFAVSLFTPFFTPFFNSFFTYTPHEGLLEARLAVLCAQTLGGAVPAHASALQHGDGRAQLLDIGQHVRGEEERPALGGEPAQHR